MNSELVTATGQPINHLQEAAVDERFAAITQNPFLHGCCDCGLWHQVEYKIVDAEGHELQIPAGAMLALRFSRDEEETKHFRGQREADGAVHVWRDMYEKIQDALLDASIAGVAGAGVLSPADMRLAAIQRYRTDLLFNKRIQELASRLLQGVVKHEVELGVLRKKADAPTVAVVDVSEAEALQVLRKAFEGRPATLQVLDALEREMTEGPPEYRVGDKVRLLKSIWDDGEDHHPPSYLAYKGEVLIVRRGLLEGGSTLAVSHSHRLDASFSVTLDEVEPVREEEKGFTVEDVEIRAAVDPAVGGAELYTPCVPVSFIGVRGKVTFSPGGES